MFITCLYAILEPESGRLLYANAGHDLPYRRRVGRSEGAEELRARGMPLGPMPEMKYEEKEIVLEAGDRILFHSDGIVEAHDPRGDMFGFPKLRALVAEHGEETSLLDFLMEELYSFVGRAGSRRTTSHCLRCAAPLSLVRSGRGRMRRSDERRST
jgi:serine phosphatase RsbU (regulator of sigma subunit)